MPERLDRVTVALNGGDVVLSWASREALMLRLQETQESSQIRHSFTAVGASRPVALSPAQRADLIVILDDWPVTLPQDLQELRDALIADLHGRE
jgi:hypothetical protein